VAGREGRAGVRSVWQTGAGSVGRCGQKGAYLARATHSHCAQVGVGDTRPILIRRAIEERAVAEAAQDDVQSLVSQVSVVVDSLQAGPGLKVVESVAVLRGRDTHGGKHVCLRRLRRQGEYGVARDELFLEPHKLGAARKVLRQVHCTRKHGAPRAQGLTV